ncbi:hypothetical protein KY316_02105, partial [Candidatus Woesearchaeota archaeon]|nr:hypothetical protein [Candidatus Woesearchaeota archaeon]
KDVNGTTIFGINLTTDINGDFNYTLNTSSFSPGNYTVYANDLNNSLNNKNVNLEITSPAPVSNSLLVVSPPKVQEGKNVNINGYNFSINSTVEILIKDENGTTVFGINITTDLNGDFNYAFNSSTLGTGNYTIFANDLANPLNDKSVSLEIIKKAAPGKGGPGGTDAQETGNASHGANATFLE